MLALTLQAHLDGTWTDVALLEFPEPASGPAGPCYFEYDLDHVAAWFGKAAPLAAASLRLPVEFGPICTRRWPAFLDDIRPLGGARTWWLRRLGLPGRAEDEMRLLREGTIAPIGHLRVKEAVPPKSGAPMRFPRQLVVERDHAFLEYAAEQGAQVGGATGAGGEAPKLLVRVDDDDHAWIDVWQDEPAHPGRHYLVKFARGARSERDRVVLRSEHVYYRALAVLGIDTIDVGGMWLEEGDGGPSLWLPRFDVARRDGRELRYGVESVYSLVGKGPGAYLTHQEVLAALRGVLPESTWPDALLEYIKRDLLNVVFGNSDNHGRNMALLKSETGLRFAPVYDFAPMKMDPDVITRTTKWEHFEQGGVIDWPGLLASFGPHEELLRAGLAALARELRRLPELLIDLGLPDETLRFPALDLAGTERKLRAWTLL